MMRIAMTPAASGLLRGLLSRSNVPRDRILLTEFRSVDWQSLTFVGERHEIQLRIPGPDAEAVATALTGGLSNEEFAIPGQIVADIVVIGELRAEDGSVSLTIEALTIAD